MTPTLSVDVDHDSRTLDVEPVAVIDVGTLGAMVSFDGGAPVLLVAAENADNGQPFHSALVVQVMGNEDDPDEVSFWHPLDVSRRNAMLPPIAVIAIQYFIPLTIGTATFSFTSIHLPPVGAEIVPVARSLFGCVLAAFEL